MVKDWTYRDGIARILRQIAAFVEPTRFKVAGEVKMWINGERVYSRKPTPWWKILTR